MKKLEKKQMLMLSGGSKGFWNGVCTAFEAGAILSGALMLSGVGATVVVGGALACVVYQGYNN
jgi:hypothetical protein